MAIEVNEPGQGVTYTRSFRDAPPERAAFDCEIKNSAGKVVFRQERCLFPSSWSQQAANVTASKYFYGPQNKGNFDPSDGGREHTADQLFTRIVGFITNNGFHKGYFDSPASAHAFGADLLAALLGQLGCFNSPVLFNCGLFDAYGITGDTDGYYWDTRAKKSEQVKPGDAYKYPQGSACFIIGVRDKMESILNRAVTEGMLFKYGSGTGSNEGAVRSRRESLSGGGRPSGPLSFMTVYDAVAATVKSGGKCLAPDQPVFTAGGVKTAKALADAGRDFTVLSYSRRLGRVAAKTARAWKSGRKEVVAVKTDKGEFHVSFDHPFMLRTGEAVRAAQLQVGMSLMPITTRQHNAGYVAVRLRDGTKRSELVHRLVASDIMGHDLAGKVVHHGAAGIVYNEPANLAVLADQATHAALHSDELVAAGQHVFQQRRFPKRGNANGMHRDSAFWQNSAKVAAYRDKQSSNLKSRGTAAVMQRASAREKMMNVGYRLINAGHSILTFEAYCGARLQIIGRLGTSREQLLAKFKRQFGSYDAFLTALKADNHRVLSVTPISEMDVYSVEVDDDELDDKRDWSEHNYMIAPIGSTDPFVSGVVSLNTRRAAKMSTMFVTHPDILEFIEVKSIEEKKAHALIEQGYSADFNGDAYGSVKFQNVNMSVRATDTFMRKWDESDPDPMFQTLAVTTGEAVDKRGNKMPEYSAKMLGSMIASGAHLCGDPGVQYDGTIQAYHTCPNTAPINSSNPCCFVGDTLVDTSEGRLSLSKLAEMSDHGEVLPFAISYDKQENLPRLAQIERVWQSGTTTNLVEVVTSKGLRFRCTPEHVWLLRNGSEVAAQSLKPGDRLRKIGRSSNVARSNRAYINHKCTAEHPSGSQYMSRWMWEQANGPIPTGFELHHKNEDCTDDRLSNFELKAKFEHRSDHARGSANRRYIHGVTDTQLVEVWEAIEAMPRQTHLGGDPVTPTRWNSYIDANNLKSTIPKAGSPTYGGRIRGMTWVEFTAFIESKRELVNDSVVSVTPVTLAEAVPVFDASVPETRNFSISDESSPHSIVVHNSEYLFIDDSACNLASVNLLKFRLPSGRFDTQAYMHAVELFALAQDILVDSCSYPTQAICENSHKYRPLGQGFANLGALIMSYGLAYDSQEARCLASCISAVMHGMCNITSSKISQALEPFEGLEANREPMRAVLEKHRTNVNGLCDEDTARSTLAPPLFESFFTRTDTQPAVVWDAVLGYYDAHGSRNSQVTVIAPTGTIAFVMDCDTTGIEPDIALVKYKLLAGGGNLKIINQIVPEALNTLGYDNETRDRIIDYINAHDTIEGSPDLKAEHLSVFDCAFEPPQGGRSIHYRGHLRMMAAVQPFLSGAISKCVTGDTVVATTAGLTRIAALSTNRVADTFSPLPATLEVPTGDGTTSRATEFYFGGTRPVWRATLADGRVLTGTAPHRVRTATPDGLTWTQLPDLQPGDFVGLCLGTQCWGGDAVPSVTLSPAYGSQHAFRAPARLDYNLGLFLGMLTADGHVARTNYTVGFTKDSQEARDLFKRLLVDLFGLNGHDTDDDRREGGPDGFTGVTVGSKSLMEWLDGIGWTKDNIPSLILGGTRDAARGFLSGLYLDGYITKQHDVAISQSRRSLLLDAQILWDNLGVATYFTLNPVDGRDYPVLHALGCHRKEMSELIEWIEPHKRERAIAVENADDCRPMPLRRRELEAAIRDARQTQQFRSIFDPRTYMLGRRSFLAAADAIAAIAPGTFTLTPEERQLHYVHVVSVEYAGEQEVFDISVPGPEAFVANGIVNHNTVNVPNCATVEEIEQTYIEGWRLGLKAVAIYRDGSKRSQPLSTKSDDAKPAISVAAPVPATPVPALTGKPVRVKLPPVTPSTRYRFEIDNHEGYIHTGLFPDGSLGEIFITMQKAGSTIDGLMNVIASITSISLQYGVPVEALVKKLAYTRFEPAGIVRDLPHIKNRFVTSIADAIFRFIGCEFIEGYRESLLGEAATTASPVVVSPVVVPTSTIDDALSKVSASIVAEINAHAGTAPPQTVTSDSPVCDTCGSLTVRCGTCYRCFNCGNSMGCS